MSASDAPRGTRDDAPRGPQGGALDAPLRPLQEWFLAVVTHPASAEEAVRTAPAIGGETVGLADLERLVLPSARLTAAERVAVYRDGYRARLVECLADDYPALKHALGGDAFEDLAASYVARYPSCSPNLNAYGRRMPDHCRAAGTPVLDFGADLAALEWGLVEVLHAGSERRLSPEDLARLPPEAWPKARFAPNDTVRVLELAHPANAYYQAFRDGEAPGFPSPLPSPAWSAVAVFRDGTALWRMNLSRAMCALLSALLARTPLGAALEALSAAGALGEDEAPQIMQWFRDWAQHGFFERVEADPPSS